jgi:hypothetical protein
MPGVLDMTRLWSSREKGSNQPLQVSDAFLASLRSQGAGSVFLISITNHRVPMSSTWLQSTSYHTSKSEVLLTSHL